MRDFVGYDDDFMTDEEWDEEEAEEREDILSNDHGAILYEFFYPSDGVRHRRDASRSRTCSGLGPKGGGE